MMICKGVLQIELEKEKQNRGQHLHTLSGVGQLKGQKTIRTRTNLCKAKPIWVKELNQSTKH